MRIEYHRTLIADAVRNRAFHDALQRVIRKGETVVADIGAGTGLLGLMAARLGAKEVFLYEAADVAGVAAQIVRKNKARNCHVLPCHSTEMQDPPQVDVVVSETLGNFALEENIIDTLADARRRFLKPGGIVIPCGLVQYVAPVVSDRFRRELCVWDDVGYGLDLSQARTMSLNNVYVRKFTPDMLLDGGSTAVAWDKVDLTREVRSQRRGEASWRMEHRTTIHGFALWWQAELVAGVRLSTAPDATPTHWEQLFFPLLEPMTCGRAETLGFALRSRSSEEAGTHLAWTAYRQDAAGKSLARQSLDLDKGYLP